MIGRHFGLIVVFIVSMLLWTSVQSGKQVFEPVYRPNSKPIATPTPQQKPSPHKINKTFGKLPLRFEANEGQTNSSVKYLSRGPGYSLYLTPQEAVLVLTSGDASKPKTDLRRVSFDSDQQPPPAFKTTSLRMKLLGANPNPEMGGEDELITKSNYYIGSDPEKWRRNVSNYGKVRYKEVYPGIDLIFYGNPQRLEYDFVVAPGADPDLIRLDYAGSKSISIGLEGDLEIMTEGGKVTQPAP